MVAVWSQREVVDYGLQRRAEVQRLRQPRRALNLDAEARCDADPMLIRAALHHGEHSDEPCPVCGSTTLTNLHYTYGDQLGQYSGRIKQTAELEEMAHEYGEFKVYVVEVCPQCRWNFLISRYTLGDGVQRKPPRRQPTVEDIYG